jgi:hypothetical protein
MKTVVTGEHSTRIKELVINLSPSLSLKGCLLRKSKVGTRYITTGSWVIAGRASRRWGSCYLSMGLPTSLMHPGVPDFVPRPNIGAVWIFNAPGSLEVPLAWEPHAAPLHILVREVSKSVVHPSGTAMSTTGNHPANQMPTTSRYRQLDVAILANPAQLRRSSIQRQNR